MENTSKNKLVTVEKKEVVAIEDHQNTPKFVPNNNMKTFIDEAMRLNCKSPTKIEESLKRKGIKISQDSYYRWMRDLPAFRDWWDQSWKIFYQTQAHELIEAGVENAKKDHTWWKDMMQFMGLIKPEEPAEVTNNNQFNVMAVAFQKGIEERKLSSPVQNDVGANATDSQNGSSTNN